jgi:hypothetical protein
LFISSRHLNKKRLAPDAARSIVKKRWSKTAKRGWPEIGGVGGMRQARDAWSAASLPGRQTDVRPHGSQEMSGLNRNCCLLF